MKRNFTILFFSILTTFSSAQNFQLDFDGVNDYVNLGSNALTNVRTVEMWFTPSISVTPTSLSDYNALISRNDAFENDEMNLSFFPGSSGYGGRIGFFRNIGGTNYFVYTNSSSWNAGTCYHIAAVIESTGGMKLYVNGVLQTSTNPSVTTPPAAASEITTLGCHGDAFIRYFAGSIDEVRFWTTARTAAELAYSYTHTMPSTATGLVGYWNMNEGSGSILNDQSSFNNDGTISGANYIGTLQCVTGLQENNSEVHKFDVFPNPVNDHTYINISNPESLPFALTITDISGKIIFIADNLIGERLSLTNLIELSKGIYIVSINFKDGGPSSKTIVKL